MEFRIADTFTDSLARLAGDEQAAAKTTAFDLQMNPANPGMQFHRLDKAKDKCFWSVRINRDLRLIVHRTESSLLLCYVGHHDAAYRWAQRRKIERHPKTGAMQIVEIREKIVEIEVPTYVQAEQAAAAKPLLFTGISDNDLLAYGVPAEWLEDVNRESRTGTVSVFNGPEPAIEVAQSPGQEAKAISAWLLARISEGIKPEEIAVFVRSNAQLPRGQAAINQAGLKAVELDGNIDIAPGFVSLCPMHLAKGLEFCAVVVAACDDEVIPLQSRIEVVSDESDLEETVARAKNIGRSFLL